MLYIPFIFVMCMKFCNSFDEQAALRKLPLKINTRQNLLVNALHVFLQRDKIYIYKLEYSSTLSN